MRRNLQITVKYLNKYIKCVKVQFCYNYHVLI